MVIIITIIIIIQSLKLTPGFTTSFGGRYPKAMLAMLTPSQCELKPLYTEVGAYIDQEYPPPPTLSLLLLLLLLLLCLMIFIETYATFSYQHRCMTLVEFQNHSGLLEKIELNFCLFVGRI